MIKQNFSLDIFFGDVCDLTAKTALNWDSSAFLVDTSNYKNFLNSTLQRDTTVYTSLGDLPNNMKIVWDILIQADTVVYCPPDEWSDGKKIDHLDPTTCIQGLTEELLIRLSYHINVKNFDFKSLCLPDVIPLVDTRRCNDRQLWIAGCSISHGVGVKSHERYGQLIADELNLQCSFLTRPGSAIDWAADQILRSDIRPNDIVVWGLTNIYRLTFVHEHKLLPGVTGLMFKPDEPRYYKHLEDIVSPKALFSHNTFYNHAYAIDRVSNFCKKLNVQLIIVGLISNYPSMRFLHSKPEYHLYPYTSIIDKQEIYEISLKDLGSDNRHPGIEQHKLYKDFIIPLIK